MMLLVSGILTMTLPTVSGRCDVYNVIVLSTSVSGCRVYCVDVLS
jgi:hypothetical protein